MLIPECKPVIDDKIGLFKENQKFMYAIFDKEIQTGRGKKHIREHERHVNAQSACKKLNVFYIKLIKYRVNVSNVLSCITSAKIKL